MGPAILGSQAAAEHARPEPGQTAESEAELSSEQVREQDANGGGGAPKVAGGPRQEPSGQRAGRRVSWQEALGCAWGLAPRSLF